MNRRTENAEDEYRAFELYLQQVQEEICLIGCNSSTPGNAISPKSVQPLEVSAQCNNRKSDPGTVIENNRDSHVLDTSGSFRKDSDELCRTELNAELIQHDILHNSLCDRNWNCRDLNHCTVHSIGYVDSCDASSPCTNSTTEIISHKSAVKGDNSTTGYLYTTAQVGKSLNAQPVEKSLSGNLVTMLEEGQSAGLDMELPAPTCVPSIDRSEEMISHALHRHRFRKKVKQGSDGVNDGTDEDVLKEKEKVPEDNEDCHMAIQTSLEISLDNFNNSDLCTVPEQTNVCTNTTASLEHLIQDKDADLKTPKIHAPKRTKNGELPAKKPNSFPSDLCQDVGMFIDDHSPEMQVVFKSLSPVLLRRKPSGRSRKGANSKGNEHADVEKTDVKEKEIVHVMEQDGCDSEVHGPSAALNAHLVQNNSQHNLEQQEKTIESNQNKENIASFDNNNLPLAEHSTQNNITENQVNNSVQNENSCAQNEANQIDEKSLLVERNPRLDMKSSMRLHLTNGLEINPQIQTFDVNFLSELSTKNKSKHVKIPELNVIKDEKRVLFLDPDMAKTWHGATSKQWKQFYAPVMQSVLDEMNENNKEIMLNGQHVNTSLTDSTPAYASTSQTLLDMMHKKFCAYQYVDENKSQSQEPLMPYQFKLAHSPVIHAKNFIRVNSFPVESLSSSSPESADSSPHLKHGPISRLKLSSKRAHENKKELRAVSADGRHSDHKHHDSSRIDAEIEAVESCCWLREAGFPQYAQMYEDGTFPVDIESVERDHDFLDKDSMQSLFRRLETLNKCAIMKIRTPTRKTSDESDDEDQCALSDKWKYQRSSRQWSRKELCSLVNEDGHLTVRSTSSHDSLLADQNSSSETGDSPVLDSKMHHNGHLTENYNNQTSLNDSGGSSTFALSPRLRRAASERLKGAKNFIKRMESFKSRRGRRGPRTIVEISGPVITDKEDMQQKIQHLNCKDLVLSSPEPSSALSADENLSPILSSPEPWSDTSLEYRTANTSFTDSQDKESSAYVTTHSNISENIPSSDNSLISNNSAIANSGLEDSWNDDSKSAFLPSDYKPGTFPRMLPNGYIHMSEGHEVNYRTGSFSMGKENKELPLNNKMHLRRHGSHDPRIDAHRISVYDNVSPDDDLNAAQKELDVILYRLFEDINGLNKAIYGEEAEILLPPTSFTVAHPEVRAGSHDNEEEEVDENDIVSRTLSSPDISDHEAIDDFAADDLPDHFETRERRDSGVGSSLTRPPSDRRRYRIRWHSFQKSHRPSMRSRNTQISSLSVGQFMVLRKLSLLKLTALIEKYSPANKSGWNWSIPRFLKRHKTPDYFDKNVFGVPFCTMLQRTGQALPQCILHAMRYLRKTAVDAVGIFRKSGVRSRIQKLRNEVEADPVEVSFEELQAYDVADLLKQYFRELPECLLTNKLSEVFTSIFINVPQDLRLEAMQSAIMLMPDENREVLQTLLLFLSDISQDSSEHHMNASNLAVCFAPSLFNMGVGSRYNQSPSPRRARKNLGVPDAKELQEQKAAHECLTAMVQECKKLFIIPPLMMRNCRFSYIEQGDPMSLDELNKKNEDDEPGYLAYIDSCIQGLLKESRDKFRGWVTVQTSSEVELAYRKGVDNHPLRLWKCAVEVEAPPNEVLERVLNERHLWDEDLLKWHIVEKLDKEMDVFQYSCVSMAPHPTRDYCVLRSWRTDLPKGACVLISMSIEHANATPMGSVRGVELASRYLIEPCGSGRSKLTHISRVDTRGRSPEWYKKVHGHICISMIERIRDSLKQKTEGRETSV